MNTATITSIAQQEFQILLILAIQGDPESRHKFNQLTIDDVPDECQEIYKNVKQHGFDVELITYHNSQLAKKVAKSIGDCTEEFKTATLCDIIVRLNAMLEPGFLLTLVIQEEKPERAILTIHEPNPNAKSEAERAGTFLLMTCIQRKGTDAYLQHMQERVEPDKSGDFLMTSKPAPQSEDDGLLVSLWRTNGLSVVWAYSNGEQITPAHNETMH